MRGLLRARRVIGASLIVPIVFAVSDSRASDADRSLCAIADRRIDQALLTETVVVCKDFPLDEMLTTDLAQRHAIRIDVDAAALKQAGVEPDVPVTHDLRCITLKGALDIIVGGQGLIWEVRNDRIVITAKKKSNN